MNNLNNTDNTNGTDPSQSEPLLGNNSLVSDPPSFAVKFGVFVKKNPFSTLGLTLLAGLVGTALYFALTAGGGLFASGVATGFTGLGATIATGAIVAVAALAAINPVGLAIIASLAAIILAYTIYKVVKGDWGNKIASGLSSLFRNLFTPIKAGFALAALAGLTMYFGLAASGATMISGIAGGFTALGATIAAGVVGLGAGGASLGVLIGAGIVAGLTNPFVAIPMAVVLLGLLSYFAYTKIQAYRQNAAESNAIPDVSSEVPLLSEDTLQQEAVLEQNANQPDSPAVTPDLVNSTHSTSIVSAGDSEVPVFSDDNLQQEAALELNDVQSPDAEPLGASEDESVLPAVTSDPSVATSSISLNMMGAADTRHDSTNIDTEVRGNRGNNPLSDDLYTKLPDVPRDATAASSGDGGSSSEYDIGERKGPDGSSRASV